MEFSTGQSLDAGLPEYPRFNYAALVREYESRLETIERGFGMDAEFLDAWVPDDDQTKSLFYLFEAASHGRLPGLSVVLTPDVVASIDGEGLLETLRGLGGVHVTQGDGQMLLTVSFDGRLGEAAALGDLRGLSSLHRVYRDRLIRETRTITHRLDGDPEEAAKVHAAAGLQFLQAPFQDGTLLAAVDPKNHVVRVLRHANLSDDVGTRLLELFCRWLEGVPLQEIAEHGAIRLENRLRDQRQPPPVRGLIALENAGPHFNALNHLARQLFATYRQEYGVDIARNSTEEPVSSRWLAMSQEAQVDAIAKAIDQFLGSRQLARIKVTVRDVLNTTQVYVTMDGCESEKEKRSLFRLLEKHLKTILEPRLELYLPPAADRLKRDEQSELIRSQKESPK